MRQLLEIYTPDFFVKQKEQEKSAAFRNHKHDLESGSQVTNKLGANILHCRFIKWSRKKLWIYLVRIFLFQESVSFVKFT